VQGSGRVYAGSNSSGSFEPFLGPGALADGVAWAEAKLRAEGTLLVPEGVDARADLLQLGRERWVMSLGQGAVEVGAALAGALDLRPDFIDCSHV
jgi:hypothetical protein